MLCFHENLTFVNLLLGLASVSWLAPSRLKATPLTLASVSLRFCVSEFCVRVISKKHWRPIFFDFFVYVFGFVFCSCFILLSPFFFAFLLLCFFFFLFLLVCFFCFFCVFAFFVFFAFLLFCLFAFSLVCFCSFLLFAFF